jgi:hypothetical protein
MLGGNTGATSDTLMVEESNSIEREPVALMNQ